MRLLFYCSCVLVLGFSAGNRQGQTLDAGNRLDRTLDALENGLEYLYRKLPKLNLDAIWGVRRLQEQLQSFLDHQPQVFEGVRSRLDKLRDLAKRTADVGTPLIYAKDPKYAAVDGLLMSESKKISWYPSQETSDEYIVEAVNCSAHYYNSKAENECYRNLSGGNGKLCDVGPSCVDLNEQYHQRSYGLTHQVLFWHAMESKGCVDSVPADRQKRLCSNVMRDARNIAEARFPSTQQDLFMEQVGFCGFWGFKDFNQPQWLEQILDWQQDSGCYYNDVFQECFDKIPEGAKKRVKRREILIEEGCYAHSTTMALLALVANVRFEAENIYEVQGRKSTMKLITDTGVHKSGGLVMYIM